MKPDARLKVSRELDPETVATLRRDGTFFSELVGLFGKEVSLRLTALAAAVEGRNFDGVARAAHSLTGTAISLGATTMRDRCLRIEDMARRRSLNKAKEELRQLRATCNTVRSALERAMMSG